MRRLYSTFAQGLPGLGLLLIRLAVGIAACAHSTALFMASAPQQFVLIGLVHVSLGALLIAGLWTPVAAALLALVSFADAYEFAATRWFWVSAGIIDAAVALIGPGRWSVDARLFGWKRIEIKNRRRPGPPA